MRGTLNFDGGGQAPGPITAGAVVQLPDLEAVERGQAWAQGTNNQAEYRALILGLELAHELGVTDIKILGDSKLVVEQVHGSWKVKDDQLRALRAEVFELLDRFDDWEIDHVRREENIRADAVGRRALADFDPANDLPHRQSEGADLRRYRDPHVVPTPGVEGDIETRVRTLWKEAFNERKLDALDAITAPGFLNHNALPGTPRGPEGHRHVVERLWKAFPDAHFEIEHLASNGDTVICVGRMSGTHRDTLLGVPATGRKVEWRQCHLYRFDDTGRAVEHDAIRDDVGLLRQFGEGTD